MNLMNGAPVYCPPTRHKTTIGERKPLLSELPALVEKAIADGLITRPAVKLPAPEPPPKRKHEWHYVSCKTCGIQFERGHRNTLECVTCRRPLRNCKGCEKFFKPPTKKRKCCSEECSKAAQIKNFHETKARTKKNK